MNILGINYGGHDTSACIISKGKLLAACEEERYDKNKHTRNFPILAIRDCLKLSKLKMGDIDEIAFGMIPQKKIDNLYTKAIINDASKIKLFIQDIKKIEEFLDIKNLIRKKTGFKKQIKFYDHHECHLASAFFPSNFKKSIVTSYDGIGEINSALFAVADRKTGLKVVHNKNIFPHSIGLLYSAVTYFLGWRHHCDEGIIMGLAPYGNPYAINKLTGKSYINTFRKILFLDKKDKLTYKINLDWIEYQNKRDTWISEKFKKNFGKKREYDQKILSHHKNIAAALQLRIEEIIIKQLKFLKQKYKIENLSISGGVGLNCSLNGKILKSKIFKKIFVQPASGDSGVAVGAAILSNNINTKKKFKPTKNFYLGRSESLKKIQNNLKNNKLEYKNLGKNIFLETAKLLFKGKIIGWYQNGAEFGPRALGNRSILCKPFPSKMRDHLNKNVKFREEFRPFAPSILEEHLYDYFDISQESEHMLIACKVKKNKKKFIPATVHVDNSCRVQSVNKNLNEKFWKLINEFNNLSGIPVLLNTSFNIKGMPIVNSSNDAIKCFLKYKIDFMVLDNLLISKKN
jgi:carbamoyltransferase